MAKEKSLLTKLFFFEKIEEVKGVMRLTSDTKLNSGLNRNTAAALTYVLGPITGVIFLILEKDSFVRFHAIQSIVVFLGLFVPNWLLILTVVLAILSPVIWIATFVLWLLLIYKAWQGEKWEVPLAGKIVNQLVEKL